MHRRDICHTKLLRIFSNTGFSLIELVTVVAVIGVAAAVIVPSIQNTLPSIRLRAASSDLHGAFMQTRGMAIKQNINCALTFNQVINGITFAYIAYEDADGNFQYDAGETIFIRMQQWPNDVVLDPDPDPATGGVDGLTFPVDAIGNPSVTFRPTGIPTRFAGGFINGTAFLIAPKTDARRSVGVRQAGNIIID